jgi:hypothetical protein
MPQKFYVGNYGGPISVTVFGSDGVTPWLPVSATVDIYNLTTGALVVDDGVCTVTSGLAAFTIPQGSPATDTAGRYVGYFDVLLEVGNLQTEEAYYNVYEKTSYYILERWRAKVQDSALTEAHVDDDAAREWIDQAVDWINKRFDSGYTSVLGAVSPTMAPTDLEFIASVGSLLARKAWYAGRGTYRDDEISYDARSLAAEEAAFEQYFEDLNQSGLYGTMDDVTTSLTNRNRDGVFYRGRYYDEPDPLNLPYYDEWVSSTSA